MRTSLSFAGCFLFALGCASTVEHAEPLSDRPTSLLEPLAEYGEVRRRVEWNALRVCERNALGVVFDACWQGWRVTASAPSDGRVDTAYFTESGLLAGFTYYTRVGARVLVYGELLYGCTPSPMRAFFCVDDPRTPPP